MKNMREEVGDQEPAGGKAVKQAKQKGKKLVLPEPLSLSSYGQSALVTTTREGLKETLATYGVAIIPRVLSEEECAAFEQGVWQSLNTLSSAWPVPISKEDESSWKGLLELFPMHSMLIQHFGLGHAQFVWELRQNPKVLDLFSHLWNVKPEELLVSFDGLSVHMPPETTGRGAYKSNTWYHCDQRFTESNFACVQSWATALDVRPGDATLTVLLGSHRFHGDFASRFDKKTHKEDWYKLATQEELDYFVLEKKCEPISIACPAGSLVFWDSRTMHAGQESLTARPVSNFRMAVYLCYLPRSLATTAALKKKQKAFNELRMTSHWPHKPILFGKSPRTYGKAGPTISQLPKPTNVSKEMGMKLAGF